jgi:hypothetical protein
MVPAGRKKGRCRVNQKIEMNGVVVNFPADFAGVAAAAESGEYNGYSLDGMKAAFDMIAPKPNWKMPVDAVIPVDMVDIAAVASEWYGAGKLVVVGSIMPGWKVQVKAPGYYAATGA